MKEEKNLPTQYVFTVPGKPENTTLIKLAVCAAATNAKMDVEKIDDLAIATGEAFKNVCCHGEEGWSCCVEVSCESDGECMTVSVEDKAAVHDIPKEKRPCLDCPKEGDLGVQLIKSLMDTVEFSTAAEGCKSVRMTKRI